MASATQHELEAALRRAVEEEKVPNAVVHVTNADGSFTYSFATGHHDVATKTPIGKDAMFMLASQTKLLTSIIALQAVEQGHLTLDQDVTPHIPELSKFGILTGFDDAGAPRLVDRQKPITLRHLLTHASGADYGWTPDMLKHVAHRGGDAAKQALAPTVLERYEYPLLFEAGEGWNYSPGLDWIGLLLLRLTGEDLQTRLQEHILRPLGLPRDAITFWATRDAALERRVPRLATRTPGGRLAPSTAPHLNSASTECFGGHGAYADLAAYLQVQRSLLANDGRLLRPESVDAAFTPQLGPTSHAALNAWASDFSGLLPGVFSPEIPLSYGLAGAVQQADWPAQGRRAGTLLWSGYFNPIWYIDRASGVAWTFGTNMLPPGDARCKEVQGEVERAVYKMLGEWRAGREGQK